MFAKIPFLFYSGCRCSSSTCKSVHPGRFIWGNMFFAMNAADSLLWTRHIPFSPQDQATKPDQIVSPNGRSWPSTSSYLPSHTSFPFAWNKCITRPPSVVKIILPKVLLKATTLVFFCISWICHLDSTVLRDQIMPEGDNGICLYDTSRQENTHWYAFFSSNPMTFGHLGNLCVL